MLGQLRGWMAANPDEVVTLFIEDHVDASLIAADVETAGLLPLVHEPVVGAPWPTLGEMIRFGERLVVMLEEGVGGVDAPWLANGFEHTQETPYTFPTVASFSCDPNRGAADAPLPLLNHWLFGFRSLVTDAQLVNSRDVLLPRAEQCRAERGQLPNFVAVNFVAIGDVDEVIDVLNGVDWSSAATRARRRPLVRRSHTSSRSVIAVTGGTRRCDEQHEEYSMTEGIKAIIYPVRDLAQATILYSQLLGVEPDMDEAYYVGQGRRWRQADRLREGRRRQRHRAHPAG